MAIEGMKLQMWRKKLWVSIKTHSVNVEIDIERNPSVNLPIRTQTVFSGFHA
jgi:hypothetical protein